MDEEKNIVLFSILNAIRCLMENLDIFDNDYAEDYDLEIILYELFNHLPLGQKPVRILNYYEITIPALTDKQFQMHFRITRQAFMAPEHLLSPLISSKGNHKCVEERKQIHMILWLLATPDSFRSIGERFDVSKSSLWKCFFRVVKSPNKIVAQVIYWPSAVERRSIATNFRIFGQIPNVVGAIDGTYVPIKAPHQNPEIYINRKCFHGITLQAIADCKLRFLHCYAGYPSSVSDIRIFRNSDIHRNIMENPDLFFGPNEFIIGDKAYPVYKWCIPPFIDRGNLGNIERNFNTVHATLRQVIERTFALYYGRMRHLRYLDMNRADLYAFTIIAACIIHNVCILKSDEEINNYIAEGYLQMRQNQLNEDNAGEVADIVVLTADGRRRNQIANNLLQVPRRE